MTNMSQPGIVKNMLRTTGIFAGLLTVGSLLIYFGTRNDAVTVARSIKAGVLTADEVNTAFQNVGGRLVERPIIESQHVKKGEVLAKLDDTDTRLAMASAEAALAGLEATLALEKASIETASRETDRTEQTEWRSIEEKAARVKAAEASYALALKDYHRAEKLLKTGSTSKSAFDAAQSTLTNTGEALRQGERQLASATIGATPEDLKRLKRTGSAEGMTLAAVQNARETIANRRFTVAQLAAQRDAAKVQVETLKVQETRLTLRAPEDGTVKKVLCEAGEMVTAGAPVVLLETDRRYFDIYVDETQAGAYRPGTPVKADVPALGKSVTGTVRFTEAAPSFADLRNTRERGQADLTSFQVRIYVAADEELLTGMTLEVTK